MRKKRVFFSYAHEDVDRVRSVNDKMVARGIVPWFDEVDLTDPDHLEQRIRGAIGESEFFLLFLSRHALRKTGSEPGFLNRELDVAYKIAQQQPMGDFTMIPVRLEHCSHGDSRTEFLDYYDFFPESEASRTLERLELLIGIDSSSGSAAIESLYESAKTHLQANNRGAGKQALDRLLGMAPNHAKALHLRGCILEGDGDVEGAIAEYSKAIDAHPGFAIAYCNRGLAYCNLDDIDRGVADYNESIRLNPNRPTPYNNRGIERRKRGDLDGALEDFNKAVELVEEYAGAYANRANVFVERGEFGAAVADFDLALKYDPQNRQAYFGRGSVRHHQADHDGALSDFSRLIELWPTFRQGYFHRALVREDIRDLNGAIEDYSKSLSIEPTANAYFNRGHVLNLQGYVVEAVKDWGRALALDPTDQGARNMLERAKAHYESKLVLDSIAPKLSARWKVDESPKDIVQACIDALASAPDA